MPVRTSPASAASGSKARGSVSAGRGRIASNFALGQRTPSATKDRMRTAVAAHAKSQPGIARSVAPPMPWADAASGRARTKPVRSAARPARRGVRVMSYVFVRRRRAGAAGSVAGRVLRRGRRGRAVRARRRSMWCGPPSHRLDGTPRTARHGGAFPPDGMRSSAPRRDPRTTDTLRRVKKTSIYLEPELDEALARRAAPRAPPPPPRRQRRAHEGGFHPPHARRRGPAAATRAPDGRRPVRRRPARPRRSRREPPRAARLVPVVLDTSIVVALMRARATHHERVRRFVETLDDDLVTSPLAVAEMDRIAAALGPDFSTGLWEDLRSGAYAVRWWADAMLETIAIAREHPEIGLTDASLVALAARLRTDRIATLDLDHFRSLTTPDGQPFVLLPDDAT